ncbi:hypothetical protein [Sulfurimonas sp.]
MLLFGHRFIQSEKFYHILDTDAIVKTPPNSTLYLDFSENNLDTISYVKENGLNFTLNITTITQLIYAQSLGAEYIALTKELAKSAQSIAETYLFDAKILVHINHEDEIEEMAILGIDGVVFPEAIIKISS